MLFNLTIYEQKWRIDLSVVQFCLHGGAQGSSPSNSYTTQKRARYNPKTQDMGAAGSKVKYHLQQHIKLRPGWVN